MHLNYMKHSWSSRIMDNQWIWIEECRRYSKLMGKCGETSLVWWFIQHLVDFYMFFPYLLMCLIILLSTCKRKVNHLSFVCKCDCQIGKFQLMTKISYPKSIWEIEKKKNRISFYWHTSYDLILQIFNVSE